MVNPSLTHRRLGVHFLLNVELDMYVLLSVTDIYKLPNVYFV